MRYTEWGRWESLAVARASFPGTSTQVAAGAEGIRYGRGRLAIGSEWGNWNGGGGRGSTPRRAAAG